MHDDSHYVTGLFAARRLGLLHAPLSHLPELINAALFYSFILKKSSNFNYSQAYVSEYSTNFILVVHNYNKYNL